MIDNQVVVVSNYATEALQKTLDVFAENDYKLVNTILAKISMVSMLCIFSLLKSRQKGAMKNDQ